jgi:tetratricopeptide (TPR) repeat protein
VAECCWKAARGYDALGEHLTAAKNFALASDNYKNAAEKIPQLKSFYQDHACYMQAWSEIEKARHHHERQEYGLAKEHFEKAADLHRSLKQWGYLEFNYCAWAQVEKAEELSRNEQSEDAIKVFEQASQLFSETKKSLQTQISKIEDNDEKQMATTMLKATDLRHEYCDARIALEEARILDKKGDHYSSSEKYRSAAEQFERMGQASESEQEQREMKFITTLSRAWQKMTMAEAKSSPTLYVDASQLFEQTEELSPNEKTKMLVLGHSHFCKALEAGTTFIDTRNSAAHQTALQQLASASNYYVRADFENAAEYAKATKLLFDAFAYMDNAEKESDPEKKTRLYTMAEKLLQTSAGSYTKAAHPEKREQVLRLLGKTREERKLAASLTEVLHAPSIVSTTRVLTAPTPTHEEAVGSERFEHADVQANLIIRQKELKVGENLSIALELVNAGKGSAVLTKVTEIIPEGFELAEEPENCRVEDSYLNLRGRRLEPLKTKEVKLVLRPTVQGTFSLKPTVLYLDETGKYKSHEPEPVTIVVKELGIKGWLKGER